MQRAENTTSTTILPPHRVTSPECSCVELCHAWSVCMPRWVCRCRNPVRFVFLVDLARAAAGSLSKATDWYNYGLGRNLISADSNCTCRCEGPPRMEYLRPWLAMLPQLSVPETLVLCLLQLCCLVIARSRMICFSDTFFLLLSTRKALLNKKLML